MFKLKSSFRELIRRIKEFMDAVFMTIGGVLVPLGFTLLFYAIQSGRSDLENYGIFLALIGLLCWILSFWFARGKDKESNQNQRRLEHLLLDIDDEIKGLREDLEKRGGQNVRNKSNPPTDKQQ